MKLLKFNVINRFMKNADTKMIRFFFNCFLICRLNCHMTCILWNKNNALEVCNLILLLEKEGNVLFNDALNTFYLRLYGVGHMVNHHSDSERGNPLPPHGLLFPNSSKGSFICTIPQTG